jgi:hypothetical protein
MQRCLTESKNSRGVFINNFRLTAQIVTHATRTFLTPLNKLLHKILLKDKKKDKRFIEP